MSAENNKQKQSPRVTHISWGCMEVAAVGRGRDFKLYPGGGRKWDWTETGTHHVPGIQPADVEELLDHGSEVVILTRGMELALQTCPETLQMLRELPYDWRSYDPEDALRFYALRMRELGMIKSSPQKIISQGTDWH